MDIRLLRAEEFDAIDQLRLKALQTNPESFLSTFEETIAMTRDFRLQRHNNYLEGGNAIIVAVDGDTYAGMTGLIRETRLKIRHIANIWGVFVAPEFRGKGLSRRMMEFAIEEATSWQGVEQIKISVVSTNTLAHDLYERLGFVDWGHEPRAAKVGDTYWDETHMIMHLGTSG